MLTTPDTGAGIHPAPAGSKRGQRPAAGDPPHGWRDDTNRRKRHNDFMARLASLVPTPRVNLTRYHGVFAPNHRLRELVRPAQRGRRKAQTTDEPAPARHVSMTWAQRLKRVLLRASCPLPSALRPPPCALRLFRIAPGDLVKIDILTCEHCSSAVKAAAPAHPARAAFVHPCTASRASKIQW